MRQNHDPARSRRAAILYREGGITFRAVCERFGISGNRGGPVSTSYVKWFERGQEDQTRWCGHDGLGSIGWVRCPYGEPGDRLWVRETWGLHAHGDESDWFRGSARGVPSESLRDQFRLALRADWGPLQEGCFWRPAIFMPRWASRITLEITEVRVQRLQEISAADACDEGAASVLDPGHPLRSECYAKHGSWTGGKYDVDGPFAGAVDAFATLWDSINGKRAAWDSNPWVWALTFRRLP